MDTTNKEANWSEEIKARVPKRMKRKVEVIARRKLVSVSDVVREALDLYVTHKKQEVA